MRQLRGRLAGEDLRLLLREQGSRPVLGRLHGYLIEVREQLLPKSEAGQAVNYILKNWTALTRYCENPDLSIDNNHTERSLRGWCQGRPRQLDLFRQRSRRAARRPFCAASSPPANW